MATFGSAGNQYSPTIYGFSMANPQSVIDKTILSTSMWKSTIKLSISPAIEDGENVRYDHTNAVSIYLTPVRAQMLADLLNAYKLNRKAYAGYGVNSTNKLITIQEGSTLAKDEKAAKRAGDVLIIRQMTQDGIIESSYAYEFRTKEYGAIKNFDPSTSGFKQDFDMYKDLELNMLIMQLQEYAKSMTNCVAFTVADTLYPCLEKIATKVGADLNAGGYGGNYNRNNYFNTNSGSGVQNAYVQPANTTNATYGLQAPVSNGLESLMG